VIVKRGGGLCGRPFNRFVYYPQNKKLDDMDNFLLSYLEKKYGVSEGTPLYSAAEKLLQRLWQGSVCIPVEDSLANSEAVGKKGDIRPLIFDDGKLYIQKYFIYQTRILEKIDELLENNKLHIITGGPGTGKTTSLAKIIKDRLTEKILLAAPTGKAALRMRESLSNQGKNLEAKTLHSLLGYKHLSVSFKHTKENSLDARIIAIDECSMIDLPMMSKLLDAVPNDCDLYLLGDKNQLASVEAGSVFADICEKLKTNKDAYKELTKNYRTENASGIYALSKDILAETAESFNNENIEHYENKELKAKLPDWYKELFEAKDKIEALGFLKTFQILCAMNVGINGTKNINNELGNLAREKKAKFTPIIITENNYQLNLFNGDVGVVDEDNKQAYFYANKNEIKEFPLLTLPASDLAFAITIHKSQGSEYKKVAVVYPDRESEFLTRELLYTAITRAKEKCFIFGNKEVLAKSCKRKIFRASGIR
jgi:exodeoxyribonuclease V alpha subunit